MAAVEVPELVELGPEDSAAVAALLGRALPPASRWVGVAEGGRLIGAAGWVPVEVGVRLLGPVVTAPNRDRGYEEELIGAVEELAAEDTDSTGRPIIEASAISLPAARLRVLGYRGEPPTLSRLLPTLVEVPTATAMQALGRHLAGLLRAGDLVIATGELGAGKTTLTQGIGAGLGVAEPVTSPTFVLSRIHPGGPGRPDLVHVDAYRLAGADEVDDLDLDHDLDSSVTVIEWGAGLAEQLTEDRLEIDIRRGDDPADDGRLVVLRPVGDRWAGVQLAPQEGTLS